MILAEALSLRKDLQKRIEQLKSRLLSNVRIQEGDRPAEEPDELLRELDTLLAQLQNLVARINKTNIRTRSADGQTLTEMMAGKEMLAKKLEVLRAAFDQASATQDRYSRSEIKMVTTVDIKDLNRSIDKCSQNLRSLDMTIQSLNFSTELAE